MRINWQKILPWCLFCLGTLFYCYEYLLRTIPGLITSELMSKYAISAGSLGHLVAVYYYAYTPMQIPVGALMDIYGPKKTLSFATLLCAFGGIIFSSTEVYLVAAIGRFLVGFGSAFAFVGVLKIVNIWMPTKFALATGIVNTLGVLTGMVGWLWVSYSPDIIISVSFNMGLLVCGIVLAFAIYTCIPKNHINNLQHNNNINMGNLFVNFKFIIVNYQIWLIGFIGAVLYSSLTVFAELWGKLFLVDVHNLSLEQSAKAISFVYLGWIIGGPVVGWLSDYLRTVMPLIIIGIIGNAIVFMMVLFIQDLSLFFISILLFMYGLFCSTEILIFAFVNDVSKVQYSGLSIAVVNMIVMLSGILLTPLVGVIMDYCWIGNMQENLVKYTIYEYTMALSLLPILSFVSLIASYLLLAKR